MATNNTTATNYHVMGLVLGVGSEGQPVHKTVSCGAFTDIGDAFALARELAEGERRQLFSAANGEIPNYELRSTEEGYDIVAGGEVIERFWVHDLHPNELPLR